MMPETTAELRFTGTSLEPPAPPEDRVSPALLQEILIADIINNFTNKLIKTNISYI
jgi:hypothetical protein